MDFIVLTGSNFCWQIFNQIIAANYQELLSYSCILDTLFHPCPLGLEEISGLPDSFLAELPKS